MNTAPNYLRLIPYQPVTVFGNVTDNSNKLAILFEQLVQDAPDLIYTVNDQSKFSFVNIRSMELTEYTRDELLNMHYLELVDPAYVEIVKNFYLEQKVNGP